MNSEGSGRLGSCYARMVLITESGWSQRPVAGSSQFYAALVEGVRWDDGTAGSNSRLCVTFVCYERFERSVLPSEHEPAGNPL